LKQSQEHFQYKPPVEIELNENQDLAYFVPISQTTKQLFTKSDILETMISNLNWITLCQSTDRDLMFNYRHGQQSIKHPSLKNNHDCFLIQLYTDGVSTTNPIGSKNDALKIKFFYFQLEDLPDTIRPMLHSIGPVGLCYITDLADEILSVEKNRLISEAVSSRIFSSSLFRSV
jgi:hypothetical protein